jgi:hypothetical protein
MTSGQARSSALRTRQRRRARADPENAKWQDRPRAAGVMRWSRRDDDEHDHLRRGPRRLHLGVDRRQCVGPLDLLGSNSGDSGDGCTFRVRDIDTQVVVGSGRVGADHARSLASAAAKNDDVRASVVT